MAVFNRVYCPNCKKEHNIYGDDIKELNCGRCGYPVKINPKEGNFFIEYYAKGKRKREKIGPNRTLAEIVLKKRKVEIAEKKFLDIKEEKRIKFEDFADEYLELHAKVNNRSWKKADAVNIRLLKKVFSGKCLNEITPLMIDRFKAERAKSLKGEKKTKTISPATVNRNLACLKSMFNKAIAWGQFVGENPVRQVKLFKENNKRLRFLEKEEIVGYWPIAINT